MISNPTNRENRPFVTDEPVGFEKSTVEVQNCRKITNRFRETYGIYLKINKEKLKDINM
jgi:hypothetical protein